MESERQKQQAFRDRQQANGKRGGRRASDPPNPDETQKNPPLTQTLTRALKTEEEGEDRSLDLKKEGVIFEFDGQAAFRKLVGEYPPNRIKTGQRVESAFVEVVFNEPGTPEDAFARMLANLENHKRSHEWRIKGMVPALDRWLSEGLWRRLLDEAPPVGEQLTAKTNRTLQAAAEVLATAKRTA